MGLASGSMGVASEFLMSVRQNMAHWHATCKMALFEKDLRNSLFCEN